MPVAQRIVETVTTVDTAAHPLLVTNSSNRFWLQVVNPHATARLFVSSGTPGADSITADPGGGVAEFPAGSAVSFYGTWDTGGAGSVRVIEYCVN